MQKQPEGTHYAVNIDTFSYIDVVAVVAVYYSFIVKS